jgi:acyl carrier protein
MNPERDNIEEQIIKIIADKLGKSADEISADSKFTDDLGADSLDLVELMMALEESFGCEIPDAEAVKLQTVKHVIQYINDNKKRS